MTALRVPSLAFCNDCDLMSWEGYQNVHRLFDSLSLPVGDSFWLFDPSGGDFGLFKEDLTKKGPRHDELLEDIRSGRLDVIHSAGSYGARFNNGFRPNRALVAGALEYLSKHAVVPKIWTNHGDDNNIQNIGGNEPSYYHQGDNPDSETYLLDLLLEFGVDYFWIDRLLQNQPSAVYKVLSKETCRSGHVLNTFVRYFGLTSSPNATNLGKQISNEYLDEIARTAQSSIIYQHWGCRHREDGWAYTADSFPILSDSSIESLERLADRHRKGQIQVKRLGQLLDEEKSRTLNEEAQRIGSIVVQGEKEKFDNFYFNQYNKHSINYFERRVARLNVKGERALDAGCGVGQWSFALLNHFDEVYGIDYSDTAIEYLKKISNGLRTETPKFTQGSVEELPYENHYFDHILSYGVIFCARVDIVLNEFSRVLKPGGSAYICLNADGWYEYLVDVRFKGHNDEIKRGCIAPIWNAIYSRLGGRNAFSMLGTDESIMRQVIQAACVGNYDLGRTFVYEASDKVKPNFSKKYLETYSDEVMRLLCQFYMAALLTVSHEWEKMLFLSQKSNAHTDSGKVKQRWTGLFARIQKNVPIINESAMISKDSHQKYLDMMQFLRMEESTQNRAYQPEEFHQLALNAGFKDFFWGADAGLDLARNKTQISPIYEPHYQGRPAVWECVIKKNCS